MHVLLKNFSILCLYFLTLPLVGICALSNEKYGTRKQRFGNWIHFCPHVRGEGDSLLGPLERANLNYWTIHHLTPE
jgi:hypothetical protein